MEPSTPISRRRSLDYPKRSGEKNDVRMLRVLWPAALLAVLILIANAARAFPQEAEYTALLSRIKEEERVLAEEYVVTPNDVANLSALKEKAAFLDAGDLVMKTGMLLAVAREREELALTHDQHDELVARMTSADRAAKREGGQKVWSAVGFWTFAGAGIASLLLADAFWYLGDRAHRDFVSASTISGALEARGALDLYDRLALYSAGTAVASIVLLLVATLTGPVR
jgi:hypothetical protein